MPIKKQKPKIIGIVGSRRRNGAKDWGALKDAFARIYKVGDSLVSGGCPKGGDAFAERLAVSMGLTITIHFPDWQRYDKAAGPIRNTLIARDCDVLIALVHEDRTGGTEDTIKKVLALGKKVIYA